MKELYTEIKIKASAEKVWKIFKDFSSYSNWNPFIKSFEGELKVGNKVKVILTPPDANEMVFKPTIQEYVENRKLVWLGHFIFPGIFDGEHSFEIIENSDNNVTFIQKERFKGILVPLFAKMLDNNTKRGFISMNEELKQLCETEK